MSSEFSQFVSTNETVPAGREVAPSLYNDRRAFPSGILWVEYHLGGWQTDHLTAIATRGYRTMYWRLVEQMARRFLDLGGHVDFVGSPLPRTHQALPVDLDWRTSPQAVREASTEDRQLVDSLQLVVTQSRLHFPCRVADLRNELTQEPTTQKRLILVSAMDWLAANEQRRVMDPQETRDVTRRLCGELQQLAEEFSAAVVVLAQHDVETVPYRSYSRDLIRHTIFETSDVVGSFLFLVPNPRFLSGARAYGGPYPGKCDRVTLTPTEEGWMKYIPACRR